MVKIVDPAKPTGVLQESDGYYYRFHLPFIDLTSTFGNDWFALKAEAFARFFGTPIFLMAQTVLVLAWIISNLIGLVHFDLYPFILLNLAFSLQSAYAAPLILLAQTRQSDRDKLHAEADAKHREDIAKSNEQRQKLAIKQNVQLLELARQNMELTSVVKGLSQQIEKLTTEMHRKFVQ